MDDDPGEPGNHNRRVLAGSRKGSKASFYQLE